MPYFLRTLNNKNLFIKEHSLEWVADGDIQADALKALSTQENTLSVWRLKDDKENLNRLLSAIAIGRQSLTKIDYALIDVDEIVEQGFDIVENAGKVPDDEMNTLHWDIINISALSLVKLALAIEGHATLHRMSVPHVRSIINESISAGHIQESDVKFKL